MSERKPAGFGWTLAIDYGPLVLFFLAYRIWGVFAGTGVFMVATAAAVVVSRVKLGRVSPMLWLSAILILGFGALTIFFHDPSFIQKKPTIIYAGLGTLLIGGWLLRRPLLKYVLEIGFEGLEEHAWMVLSRNWGLFFFGMALLNEVLRGLFNEGNGKFGTWLAIKVWALVPLSIAFGLAHLPFLMRNGLSAEAAAPPVE